MSHRTSHRVLAEELRLDRIEAGLPADPSNRVRKPRTVVSCPRCRAQYRKPWQMRLHLLLGSCRVVAP